MDKKNKTIVIWTAAAIVLVAIIISAIAMHHSEIPYKLSAEQTLAEMTNNENMPGIAELAALKSSQKIAFVDVRNPLEYNLFHLEGAINIPAEKILNENYMESIKEFEEQGKTILLYGATPGQVAGPWMLLKQIGIVNVKMFNGSFEQLTSGNSTASLHNETPIIDTSLLKKQVVKEEAPKQTAPKPKAVVPQRVEPAAESGGGC